MNKPNFFIVGAPKCATSALYNLLRTHPDIFMAVPKELNYFVTDLTSPHFIDNEKEYFSLFESATNYKRVGEASVWYLYSKDAAKNIHSSIPNARIIAMVRNPMEMIYSYHGQRLFNGSEDISDFSKAIGVIPERKEGKQLPENPYPTEGLFYLDIAKYTEQLKRYINTFGKDNVHIIVFDDFKADSNTAYNRVLAFLGLEPHTVDESSENKFTRNPSKRYKNKFVQKIFSNPPKIIGLIGKILLPNKAFRQKLWRNLRIMNIDWKARPPMDHELRLHLEDYYRPEIEKLSVLLERDLTTLWLTQK